MTTREGGEGAGYNVRDFGAKGDGETDDTAAFQAAVDATPAWSRSTVRVPAGHYRTSRPIKVTDGRDLLFDGDGWSNTLLEYLPPQRGRRVRAALRRWLSPAALRRAPREAGDG